jgi:hypothetical protein
MITSNLAGGDELATESADGIPKENQSALALA